MLDSQKFVLNVALFVRQNVVDKKKDEREELISTLQKIADTVPFILDTRQDQAS